MTFKEVQNCFFEYEDKRHKILQKTQQYFLKNKFQPYVWFDEEHRLRIKHKYKRGIDFSGNDEEKGRFCKIAKKFCSENELTIRFVFDFCETDLMLPKDVRSQWSTEIILEV